METVWCAGDGNAVTYTHMSAEREREREKERENLSYFNDAVRVTYCGEARR